MVCKKIIISGKVHGVFFRMSAKQKADELNLNGWVMNAMDGSVIAYVYGGENIVSQFITWCRQGPPAASVESVQVEETEFETVDGFEIRR